MKRHLRPLLLFTGVVSVPTPPRPLLLFTGVVSVSTPPAPIIIVHRCRFSPYTTCAHYYCSQVSFQSLHHLRPLLLFTGVVSGTETTHVNNNNGHRCRFRSLRHLRPLLLFTGVVSVPKPPRPLLLFTGVVSVPIIMGAVATAPIIIVHRCRFRDLYTTCAHYYCSQVSFQSLHHLRPLLLFTGVVSVPTPPAPIIIVHRCRFRDLKRHL